MLASLSWLKKYLKTTATPAEIADKLTFIGLEIEEVVDKATALKDFVIGEIKTVEKHPDSDHLHVLGVWDGKELLQIVCGAPNVRVGMKSVLAKVGVMIPAFGKKIEKGKIRGVESQGMMCAEDELSIGSDHAGIIDLNTDLSAGTPLPEVLKSDVVFDINVLPNRPDCFGVKGIARDLAACGLGEMIEEKAPVVQEKFTSPVSVVVQDKNSPKESGAMLKVAAGTYEKMPVCRVTNISCIP